MQRLEKLCVHLFWCWWGVWERLIVERFCRVDEGSPLEFWEEASEKVLIELCFSELNLDVFKSEWKIVCCASSDVAREEIVRDEQIGRAHV